MPAPVNIALIVLLTVWATQAVLCALQARRLLGKLRHAPRPRQAVHRPPVVVIMPFKGTEPRLAAALDRLFNQDYPDYRLVLVVDAERDPAYRSLQQAVARHPHRTAQILVAGEAGPRQGQKLHNQIAAMNRLAPDAGLDDVWVFADSDAVPGPQWLANMVGPLLIEQTGVTTGYRWLVPEDEPRATAWSRLAGVINSSVACTLCSRKRHNHAWGGSMAMRAAFAIAHDLRGRFTGALTDDYVVSTMCRQAGRDIYFVARCLVPTPVAFDRASFANFAFRQYLITRVYAPWLFVGAMGVTWLYVLGLLAAWATLGLWLVQWCSAIPAAVAAAALLVTGIGNQARAAYRAAAVRAAFDDDTIANLRQSLQWDRWATPIWMTLHALIVLRAAFGRTMTWRGMRYVLRGTHDVERL